MQVNMTHNQIELKLSFLQSSLEGKTALKAVSTMKLTASAAKSPGIGSLGGCCGQDGPKLLAECEPVYGSFGTGKRKRRSPTLQMTESDQANPLGAPALTGVLQMGYRGIC